MSSDAAKNFYVGQRVYLNENNKQINKCPEYRGKTKSGKITNIDTVNGLITFVVDSCENLTDKNYTVEARYVKPCMWCGGKRTKRGGKKSRRKTNRKKTNKRKTNRRRTSKK